MSEPPGARKVDIDEFVEDDEQAAKLIELIRETGAYRLEVRENDSPQPTAWVVVVEYQDRDTEITAAPTLVLALTRMVDALNG